MAIKVILMDIDGTLANSDKTISPKTIEALKKAQEAGATLVLASGRPDQGCSYFADLLDMKKHNGLYVCFNGAMVMNCQTNEILFNQCMSVEESKEVLEHLKKFDVVPMVSKGEYMYVNNVFNDTIQYKGNTFRVMEYESRSNHYKLCEIDDLAAWCDFGINKLLTYGEPQYLQDHYQEMAAPFEGRLNSMFTADFYYEFTAKGVDKAKAIAYAIESQGFKKDEMIAFGDAENDYTMLKYAGVAVAMGNAKSALKEVADYVTTSNDEDGIALALYKYMPEVFGE